jgi:tripartite-type tricarboxylate transporter receptor subunit TctC
LRCVLHQTECQGCAANASLPLKGGGLGWGSRRGRSVCHAQGRTFFHAGICAAAIYLAAAATAPAQDTFKGREINLYVGSAPDGPYDAYARLIARHLGRHLPGNPGVVVQNMPGASGRRLMGFIYNVAPKDGSAVATAQRALPFEQLIDGDTRFDVQKVTWLGSANNETNVCMAWHTSKVATIEDVRTRGMVVGSSGPSSTDSIYPNVLNFLHGMKFKVVEGYKAATETHIAMERGEVDGRCGISWDTLQALNSDWLRDKKIRILVQIGLDKVPELVGVPSVFDLSKTEEERQIWALWAAPNKMGRPFFAPPGMAADRAALMRAAFDATMKDPELRAEATKMNLAVDAISGEQVAALLKQVYATPKAVLEKAALASKGR